MKSTRYSCRILIKDEFLRQIFEKQSNIKFHENPSSGTNMGKQRDMKNPLVTFRSVANASKSDIPIRNTKLA